MPLTRSFHNPLLDSTIFKPVKELLGGNLRLMLTGSAPVEPKVLDYLKLVFGC